MLKMNTELKMIVVLVVVFVFIVAFKQVFTGLSSEPIVESHKKVVKEAQVRSVQIPKTLKEDNLTFEETIEQFVSDADYYFVAAGHVYGYNPADTVGIHPPFFQILNSGVLDQAKFMVLLGDIVKISNQRLWGIIDEQVAQLALKTYFVMGNHDYDKGGYSRNLFTEKFGDIFYSFSEAKELFFVFDTQTEPGQISRKQLDYLNTKLKENKNAKNIFLFIHELLWFADDGKYKDKYKGLVCNRYYTREFYSNFWRELVPLLEEHKDRKFYIMSGDVGAMDRVLPAFHEKVGNIELIATGMGYGNEQNFLIAKIKSGEVSLKLFPVIRGTQVNLDDYAFDKLKNPVRGFYSNVQKF